MGGVRSESEGEVKGECEGNASAADRGSLRLHAPIKTRWNSVFGCINKALQLKDAITRFSENDMELDGRIDGEDDDICQMGKLGEYRRNGAHNTSPFFVFSFIYIYQIKSFSGYNGVLTT